jgi:hypothetical protein
MTKCLLFLFLTLFIVSACEGQYAFVLKVENAMRIQNADRFSVSGTIVEGRIENNKTYYLEDGRKFDIKNVISSKSATSVPIALVGEIVSLDIGGKDIQPGRGDLMRCVNARPGTTGNIVRSSANQLPEGVLQCKINSRLYTATQVSKPVYIKQADVLNMFFQAEDASVIWLQLNNFSDIKDIPHHTNTDTSARERNLLCKIAYMPQGYRPTDMPNHYAAYEDMKGNAGISVVKLNRYHKKLALTFNGILRANDKQLEIKPDSGLFYLQDGKIDELSWDEF